MGFVKEVRVRKRAEQCTNKLASHAVDEAALTRSQMDPDPRCTAVDRIVFSKGVSSRSLLGPLSSLFSFLLAAPVRCLEL
jgi:hypothetical protein